jgi:NADH-quinone oxidoreductase subunit C
VDGQAILARLRERLGAGVLDTHAYRGDHTAVLARAALTEALAFCRDDAALRFDMLIDLTAVDYLKYPGREDGPRFDVVYHFYSFSKNDRIRVKCGVEEGEEVPSIATLFLAANWPERETWDMFGIPFAGHPGLQRILTWEGFHGHPLRKDFPLEGIDTGAAVYPEEWPAGGGPSATDPNRKVVS